MAKLTAAEPPPAPKRKLGTMRGSVLSVAPDFDARPEGTAGEPAAVATCPSRTSWPCQPGTAKNATHWMASDFAAPLEDFAESME